MENLPKISIITPNFNGAAFLENTILSVLNQNYPNLEYIIIDGGSTDGSLQIIKKYEEHLKFWISEPDSGMYHAIQKGFDKSKGEIMAWINSDDMYHKNAFFIVAEIFSTINQVNWLSGANTYYDEYGRTIFCNQSRSFTKLDFLNYDYMFIQQESVFWRRSLWEKAGSYLNLELKYAGDFELWLRFFNYDELFITDALIGGFRLRRSNQLSLDHMGEYKLEANIMIDKTVVRKADKNNLLKYKMLKKMELFFKFLKLNSLARVINYFRSNYFAKPLRIQFNRYKMLFELSK